MICKAWRVPRSTVCVAMAPGPAGLKRGPKTAISDAEIVEAIRALLAATPFHGEVRARLACSRNRKRYISTPLT
ncbi:MAG: hypothetical protein C5B56_15245 [Proteobacteria bacterium]|nr:MAG: hypothetical protein C5B56_15245 [Pseudomonadota bacterium]